jgi:hypothetical protein
MADAGITLNLDQQVKQSKLEDAKQKKYENDLGDLKVFNH